MTRVEFKERVRKIMVEGLDVKELRVAGGAADSYKGDGCLVQRVYKQYGVTFDHYPALIPGEYSDIVGANDEAVGLDDMSILLAQLTEVFGDDNGA